jgi:uncharacterized protein YegJ (DUF2314 family)
MVRTFCFPLAFLLCCGLADAAHAKGKAKPNTLITVKADDAEMQAAIEKGRKTLPHFWKVFETRPGDEQNFSLKVKINDDSKVEYFWVVDLEREDGKISGTINNEPGIVENVAMGDRIAVPEDDICDWLYIRDRKMVGNYTVRPLLKHMPAEQAKQVRKMLANP